MSITDTEWGVGKRLKNAGMVPVCELNDPNSCYDFNDAILVKRGDDFYFAADSGCSCLSPFEEVNGPDDMHKVESVTALREMLDKMWFDAGRHDDLKEGMVSEYLKAGGAR